jgi:hypothetical protein
MTVTLPAVQSVTIHLGHIFVSREKLKLVLIDVCRNNKGDPNACGAICQAIFT